MLKLNSFANNPTVAGILAAAGAEPTLERLAVAARVAWKANGSLVETAHRVYWYACQLGFKGHMGAWSARIRADLDAEAPDDVRELEPATLTSTDTPPASPTSDSDALPSNLALEKWLGQD